MAQNNQNTTPADDSWEQPYTDTRHRAEIDALAAEYAQPVQGQPENASGRPGAAGGVPSKHKSQGGDQGGESRLVDSVYPAADEPIVQAAGRVAKSVGKEAALFATDLPLQTVGAFRDVVQQVSDMVAPISRTIDEVIPLGWTPEGDFVHPFSEQSRKDAYLKGLDDPEAYKLANIPQGHSVASPAYRSVARFVIGWKGVGNALGMAGKAGAALNSTGLAANTAKGALTDMLVWDAHEQRLSDMIQQVPALQNPITEYLKSDKDDGMLEGKLKQALEGAGINVGVAAGAALLKGLSSSVKAMKVGRAAVEEAKPALQVVDDAAERATRDFLILGDPSGPLTKTVEVPNPDATIRLGADESVAGMAKGAEKQAAQTVLDVAKTKPGSDAAQAGTIKKVLPNFARINAPEDLDAVLREMAVAHADTMTAKGLGQKVTQAQLKETAKEIGLSDLMTADPKKMGAADLVAMKDAYASSGETLMAAANRAVDAPTPANLYNFRKMLSLHQTLLERFSEAKSEAGRALNALKIPAEFGSKERLLAIQDHLDSMGGEGVALELAKKLTELRSASPEAINEVVKRGALARTMDAVQEAWVLGLVSGPRSQARNILSNAVYLAQNIVERGVAGQVPGSAVDAREAAAMAAGAMGALRSAFTNAGKAFWNGTSGYGIGKVDLHRRKAISGEAFDLHGPAARVADGFGELFRVWGRALNAGDEFFKTLNFAGEVHAQAVRQAAKAGKTGDEFLDEVARLVAEPSEEIRIAARRAAEYGSFTQQLGKVGQAYQQMLNAHPVASVPFRFLTPFVKTPANIFKAGFSRSPFALAMPDTFWAEVKAGGARRDMAMTRMAMGSAVMALWSDLNLRGAVTGNGPSNPTDRQRWTEAGMQPYSVKIGDKWVNYRAVEPMGMVMGLAADITERLTEWQEAMDSDDPERQAKADQIIGSSIAAIGNSVTSATFMRSVSEFFVMMSNPDMYADRWLQNYIGTAVPMIVPATGEIAASIGGNGPPEIAATYSMLDALTNRIPGTEKLPVRDLYGHERRKSEALGPDWLSPVYVKDPSKASPISREIISQRIGVTKMTRAQGFTDPVSGITVRLNMEDFPHVWDELQQLQGHKLKHPAWGVGAEDLLNAIVDGKSDLSPVYRSLPNGDEEGVDNKGAFIKGIFADYRKLARMEVMNMADQAARTPPDKRTPLDEELVRLYSEVRRRADRKVTIQTQGGE